MLRTNEVRGLARRAAHGWVEDSAPSMGAALAFYTLVCLAPLLLVVIGVAGFFFGRDEAQLSLVNHLAGVMGADFASGVESMLENIRAPRDGILPALIGAAAAIFGAITVFAELRRDLDVVWRHPAKKAGAGMRVERPRLAAFMIVMTAGILLLGSLVASAALSAPGASWFGSSPAIARLVELCLSFLVITGLFATIFKILPNAKVAWADVWVGAAVASALFWIGKYLVGFYLGKAAVASAFGAAGAVVLLILWVYYSAQAFFLGAELTREYALRHGSRQHDRKLRKPLAEIRAANEDRMVERARPTSAA
jgi:membrane protein